MMKILNKISTYRNGSTLLICSSVLLDNGKVGYELLIVDEHLYKTRTTAFQREKYSKVFTSKKQANDYASALIHQYRYVKI